MTQSRGAINISYLTTGFSGTSTYNLSGGTINAQSKTSGYNGTGFFNQSGGQNLMSGSLWVGLHYSSNTPGSNTYNLTDGVLSTGDTVIGGDEQGDFVNVKATHDVAGNLILGNQSINNGNGTYTITGNSAQTNVTFVSGGNGPGNPNGALLVGNVGTGSFTQGTDVTDAGNQVDVAGDLVLGHQDSTVSTYMLNSGTLNVGGVAIVGSASTNNNVFNQNGGTLMLTGSANGNADYAPGNSGAEPAAFPNKLCVGGESVDNNGTGTYNLTGGALTASGVYLSFSGTGTFNQSGGSVTADFVDLGDCGGCNGGNAAGLYNLTGTGTLTANSDYVGNFGHGNFLLNGVGTQNTFNTTLSIGNYVTQTPNVANLGNYDRSGLTSSLLAR